MAGDLLLLLLAYFLGALPTGLVIGTYIAGVDVREKGSKNIGATNVWRVLGWKYGLPTFLIDVGKAALAVWLAARFWHGAVPELPILAAVAVLLGNLFNVFLGFKGGKGVAAALGVFLALAPAAIGIAFLLFVILVLATRMISLGSVGAALALPGLVYWFHGVGPLLAVTVLASAFVIYKHRANIRRMLDGTENKIKFTKKSVEKGALG